MKTTLSTMTAAGLGVLILLAGSAAPVLGKCLKKDPLFGLDVYMADKYCDKKTVEKKVVKKKTVRVAQMKKQAAPKKMRRVATGDKDIREMQTLLTKVGYNPGPIDGQKGPQTKQAANAFKTAVGLRMGTDTQETVEILRRIAGK